MSASKPLWSFSNCGNPSERTAFGEIRHLSLSGSHVEGSGVKREVKKSNNPKADTTQFNISMKI